MPLKHLNEYNFPQDLKTLSDDELTLLSYDIRDFLISSVAKTGGHLASNLGIVEITMALHKVFDTPTDKIVWDVGHQCYVHKLLTGRAEMFDSLRQEDGLSGFPKSSESSHDIFNSGHSSTSISAAMGLANARDLNDEKHSVVAVIGDGAMTGGLAFEGLNNAGTEKTGMIVVLNDNEMSISESTGSVSLHLNRLRSSKSYQGLKKSVRKKIQRIPAVGKPLTKGIEKSKDMLRYAFIFQGIFEEMGFKYYGPVDGNDVHEMVEILSMAKSLNGPVLIHAMTKKGKGYKNAENNPSKFHGIGPFDPETGQELNTTNKPSYSKVFGNKLIEMASKDDKIVAITAAMKDGTGLTGFAERFPNRFFDVGIAEAHGVTFASGLAIGGFKPFINIYSTFMQRAYDQIIMDVCMQNLPVVFMLDRAGNVGSDGETHHGVFDISYLKHMPNLTILAPKDGTELRAMMDYAHSLDGPCAIRFPRGTTTVENTEIEPVKTGQSVLLSHYTPKETAMVKPVHLWATGKMVGVSEYVEEILKRKKVPVSLINARFVKPLDEEELLRSAKNAGLIVTLEDNVLKGGFGESVNTYLATEDRYDYKILNIGWPDEFIPQGNTDSIMKKYGLDAKSIAKKIEKMLELE